jgi:hypothetical protein
MVINDWIARIQGHWARRDEQNILELVGKKLDSGEEITPEERAAYVEVLVKTKRKAAEEEEMENTAASGI